MSPILNSISVSKRSLLYCCESVVIIFSISKILSFILFDTLQFLLIDAPDYYSMDTLSATYRPVLASMFTVTTHLERISAPNAFCASTYPRTSHRQSPLSRRAFTSRLAGPPGKRAVRGDLSRWRTVSLAATKASTSSQVCCRSETREPLPSKEQLEISHIGTPIITKRAKPQPPTVSLPSLVSHQLFAIPSPALTGVKI